MRIFLLICSVLAITHVRFGLAEHLATTQRKVVDIAWSADGTRIAGAYDDSTIEVWSVDDLSNPTLTFQSMLADRVAWTPDSEFLITQGTSTEGNRLEMSATKWRASTGEMVENLMSFEFDTSYNFNSYVLFNKFPSLAISSNATKSAFSFSDGIVLINDGITVLSLENDSPISIVYMMEWSPDDSRLAVVNGSTEFFNIQVFDVNSGISLEFIYQDLQYFVTDLGWDSEGNYLATSSVTFQGGEQSSNVGIYKIESSEQPHIATEFWKSNIARRNGTPLAWHPSEFILAIGNTDAVEIYDPDEAEPLFSLPVYEAIDIEWSPDGSRIASLSSQGVLEIWDVFTTE